MEMWAVQCDGSKEIVRVRLENLIALTPPMGGVVARTTEVYIYTTYVYIYIYI